MSVEDTYEACFEHPGYHYEWIPDASWIFAGGRKCRMLRCPKMCVAALRRTRRLKHGGLSSSWWSYCEDHLYGRRILNGVIEVRVLRPDLPPAASASSENDSVVAARKSKELGETR